MNRTDHGGLLSGSTLKWLAILLMLIDHVGASLLEIFVLNGYSNSPLAGLTGNVDFWWKVDRVLRYIGRSAFPIFCFLLVEGSSAYQGYPALCRKNDSICVCLGAPL